MKNLMICLLILAGYANGHEEECVVCDDHRQYEFRGSMNTSRAQERFWRQEEQVCEKQWLEQLRKAKENASPQSVDMPAPECKQKSLDLLPKLTGLKKITQRISRR